jgi:hypothetical protein
MKQGMGGQVEAVYDNLHLMKVAFIYRGVALRMRIASMAINPCQGPPIHRRGAFQGIRDCKYSTYADNIGPWAALSGITASK